MDKAAGPRAVPDVEGAREMLGSGSVVYGLPDPGAVLHGSDAFKSLHGAYWPHFLIFDLRSST